MPQQSAAYKRAYAFLSDLLQDSKWFPGQRLPNMRDLAAHASVSKNTLRAAVAEFKRDKKLLVENRRGGIRIPFQSADGTATDFTHVSSEIHKNQTKSGIVKSRIIEETLNGSIAKNGKLPSVADMQTRYNASYHSISKAIRELAQKKFLDQSGKCITSNITSATPVLIHLIIDHYAPYQAGLLSTGESKLELMHALELECNAARVKFLVFGIEEYRAKIRTGVFGKNKPYGVITWLSYKNDVQDVFLAVRPFAFFALINDNHLSAYCDLPYNRTSQVYSYGLGDTGAIKIAHHLLQLGHRTIAYISQHKSHPFSKTRLQGLSRSFDSVKDAQVAAFQSELHQPDTIPPESSINTPRFQQANAYVEDSFQEYFNDYEYHSRFGNARSAFRNLIDHENFKMACQPLFEQALSDKSISAWVCDNDRLAVEALIFLIHHKVHVPRDISVVGFDDTFEAFANRLTTYNFNLTGLAHRIVHDILDRGSRGMASHLKPVEVEGMLIERNTTARVGLKK